MGSNTKIPFLAILGALCLAAGCDSDNSDAGGVDGGPTDGDGGPADGDGGVMGDGLQLLEPRDGTVVAALKPTFRWHPASEATIELCGDAACTGVFAETTGFGGSATFANCLGVGDYFWRVTLADDPSMQATAGFSISLGQPLAFRPTAGVMISPLASATDVEAIRLAGGRVLLLDGSGGSALPVLFEPWCETFAATGPMVEARAGFAAAPMADGKILITGGAGPSASTEIFDPLTGTFSPGPAMGVARRDHTATALADGRILVAGGTGAGPLSSAEIFDPATGAFRPVGAMTSAHSGAAAVRLGSGEILVAGGGGQADVFDPASETFSAAGSLVTPRSDFDLVALDTGGALASGGGVDTIEVFTGGGFDQVAQLPAGFGVHRAVGLADGRVLFVGQSAAQFYDPRTGMVVMAASLMAPRNGPGVALLASGRVLVAGGAGAGTTPSAEVFVP